MKNPIVKFVFVFAMVFGAMVGAARAQEEKLRLEILNGHSGGGVLSVAVSSDGKFALTGSADWTALLWDLETGKQLRRFVGHEGAVNAVAFSKDGRFVLTASADKTARLWETATGKPVVLTANRNGIFAGHTGAILSAAISPDGNFIATASEDKTARIWDASTGRQLFSIEHAGRVNSVAFSPDSRLLLTGGEDKIARLYSTNTGVLVRKFVGHKGKETEIKSVAYSPDGKKILTGSYDPFDEKNEDNSVRIWDAETTTEIKKFDLQSGVLVVAFLSDGYSIFAVNKMTSDVTQCGHIWEISSGKEVWKTNWNFLGTDSAAILPDTKRILYAERSMSSAYISEMTEAKNIQELSGKSSIVNSIDISPDTVSVLTSGASGDSSTSGLWNLKLGQVINFSNLYDQPIFGQGAFTSDGKFIANTNLGDFILFDTKSLKELRTTKMNVSSDLIGFSANGQYLASAASLPENPLGDQKVYLWKLKISENKNSENVEFKLDKDFSIPYILTQGLIIITSLKFSPDSKLIATTNKSIETSVRIWDIETGAVKKILKGSSWFYDFTFSPDGKTIATASGGEIDMQSVGIGNAASANGVRLFDVETGKEKESFGGEFKTFSNRITGFKSVAYSKDGKYIAVGSFDGKVYLLDDKAKLVRKFEGHTDSVNSVKFAEDARGNLLVVSGSSDSTTRIWNAATGEEICALVTFRDGNWAVVQTRTGRYDAPNGGEIDGIQWVYENETIELKQLSAMYYTPNLLPRLLGYNKDPLPPVVALKDIKLFPQVVEQKFDEKTGKLNIKLKSRGGGVGKTEVYVNDKIAVADVRDEKLKQNPNIPLGEIVTLTVDLPAASFVKGKENQIKIITSNYLKEIGKGNIQSRGVGVVYLSKEKEEYQLPTLYAVIGGVSDYAGDALDLRFAAKDAEDFSNALQIGAQKLFCDKTKPNCLDKVNVTTLSTSGKEGTIQPTKENFKQAFADIAARARPEDIVVVYLAGHGVSFGAGTDTYFYLTQEARSASREDLAKVYQTTAISSEELTEWLTTKEWTPANKGIRALKQVLILDTCASGSAAEKIALSAKRDLSGDQIRAIEFLKDKTGTFVLMGSTADAPSYEASQYGQGLLTYSLLQAMKGAALDKGEYIDVQQLFAYAQREVPRLAENIGGVQRPIVSAPLGKTFVIGQMTDAEKGKVSLTPAKPIMLRPLLTNPETGDDDLKLISELRKRLDAESSYEVMQRSGKGSPILVYVDDENFPGAVRVTGTYTVAEGEIVRVKAFLRRDGKTIATLPEIAAAKDKAIDELLAAIRVELAKITNNP